jgi:hypothetical protein
MRVLLGDASSLTARQCATQLAAAGHVVEVLTATTRPLARWTSHVTVLHHVGSFRTRPDQWLAEVKALLAERAFDVLIPTHDHVALLAAARAELGAVGIAVPPFASLARVQDRVAARRLLTELGLPQPASVVARSVAALHKIDLTPSLVKHTIRRDAGAVHTAPTRDELRTIADELERDPSGGPCTRVVQAVVDGPAVTLQAIYDDGTLVALHAHEDVAHGWRGAITHKRSLESTTFREHFERLGCALDWHGALTVKAVLTPTGPCYVDFVPRLVEPANALAAGVDLVSPLLDVSVRRPAAASGNAKAGVCTHQLLTALLGAVEQRPTRRRAARELWRAARHRGSYARSIEELTPRRRDLRAAVAFSCAAGATLIWPRGVRRRARARTVDPDALAESTWRSIASRAAAARASSARR